ncbi:MAG: Ig-like domain-containing protein [Catonella sp.]
MKNLSKKVALSVMVMLCLILSLSTNRTKLYAGEVLTKENIVEPKLNAIEVSLVTDDTFNLKVFNLTESQKVYFKSDDDSIASVSTLGAISALKVGETTVTATIKDKSVKEDKVFKCKVYVGPPAISIRLTLSEVTLEVGKRKTLQAILKPNTTAETGMFTSYDPEVATVSASGKILAKKAGKTIIVSSITNGRYDYCIVNVVEATEKAAEKTK